MKRIVLLLLLCANAQAATYSFFSPAQTTNVIQGLIGAGTYGSAAYNTTQFAVTPYSSITIKNGAAGTNWSLNAPVVSGGTQSGASYQSIKTPGLTGLLSGNDTGSVSANSGTTSRVLKWGSATTIAVGSLIDDGTNAASTLPLLAQVGLGVGGGPLLYRIVATNATLDFPIVAAATSTNLTLTASGASPQSTVNVVADAGGTEGVTINAWCSATNTITVRANNFTIAPVDPASAVYRVTVFNHN